MPVKTTKPKRKLTDAPKTAMGYEVEITKSGSCYKVSIPAFPSINTSSESLGRAIRCAWDAVDQLTKNGCTVPDTMYKDTYHDDVAKRLHAVNREITKFGFCALADDIRVKEFEELEKVCEMIKKIDRSKCDNKAIEEVENAILDQVIVSLRSARDRALNMVSLWMKDAVLKKYSHFVEEAYLSFFSGKFISTAMILTPVIEGILLSWYGFDLSKKSKLPTDSQLLNFMFEQPCKEPQMIHPLVYEEYIWAFSQIYQNVFRASHEISEDVNFFNRHYIAHLMGAEPFYRRNNVYKLLLLTDLLAHVIPASNGQHNRFDTEESEYRDRFDFYFLKANMIFLEGPVYRKFMSQHQKFV